MPRCANSRRSSSPAPPPWCPVSPIAHPSPARQCGATLGRSCAVGRAKGRASFPVSWRVRRSRLRPLLIAAVAAWGRAASGSNGRGLLPALGGCNGGVAPLPSVLFDKQSGTVGRYFLSNSTWLASLPKRSLRRFCESGQAQMFQVAISPDGDAAALASANAKVRPCQKLRDAPPVSRRSLSPQAPVCPARKPVTRGGMRCAGRRRIASPCAFGQGRGAAARDRGGLDRAPEAGRINSKGII